MSKDHWDAILASSPLNATAAAVTGRGYRYEPDVKVVSPEWTEPPPMRRPPPDAPHLVGVRFGRLTVIGLYAEPGKANKARWICRCACGRYVARSSKAIRNPANAEIDRCTQCRHVAFLAKSASGDQARHRAESEKARKWKPAA